MEGNGEQMPRSFEALALVVMATKRDVAHHERALYGDHEHSGLMQIGKEARGAVYDLAEEYRQDRENAVRFIRDRVLPRIRDAETVVYVAAGASLLSAILSGLALWRAW